MRREIEQDLLAWKVDKKRKPLLLRGARQVGKTYIVREFARQFSSFVEINFEKHPDLKRSFSKLDPIEILRSLELEFNQPIIPGQTLLFLDEIQESPQAIIALRYFKEELPDLHVIGAGSLLEFVLHDTHFRMPVGRVQYLYLYPLSFFEFLHAIDRGRLCDHLRQTDLHHQVEEETHRELLDLMKEYMTLGGMPAVVSDYVSRKNFRFCQDIQTDLLATYRDDFGKYAKTSQHKYLQLLFERAPGMIAQWFKYAKIDSEIQSRELKRALNNLVDSGLVHQVYATSAKGLPLISEVNLKKFKILFLDIGLVHRATKMPIETLRREDLFLLNRGALAEQLVGQLLLTASDRKEKGQLFFWVRESRGSSAEVDYVVNIDAKIIPIEVKAGATGKLRSLHRFMEERKLDIGCRISQAPLSLDKNILSIPFYLTEELPRLLTSASRCL